MEELPSSSAQDDIEAIIRSIPQRGMTWRNKKKKRKTSLLKRNVDKLTRQRTLLQNVRRAVDSYYDEFGQHIAALVYTGNNPPMKIIGTNPLIDILRKMCPDISRNLRDSMCFYETNSDKLFHLPPITANGVVTPLDTMTQAQLRAFIPLMLKYATGRGKPGWGKETYRPIWWPDDIPWANVRYDSRCDEQKGRVSWTAALKQIVLNCYTYYDRQDLLDQGDKNYKHSLKWNVDLDGQGFIKKVPNEFSFNNVDELDKNNDRNKIDQTDASNDTDCNSESQPNSAEIKSEESHDVQYVTPLYVIPYNVGMINVVNVFPTCTMANINEDTSNIFSNEPDNRNMQMNTLEVIKGIISEQRESCNQDAAQITGQILINEPQCVIFANKLEDCEIIDEIVTREEVYIQSNPEMSIHHLMNVSENVVIANNVIEIAENDPNYQMIISQFRDHINNVGDNSHFESEENNTGRNVESENVFGNTKQSDGEELIENVEEIESSEDPVAID